MAAEHYLNAFGTSSLQDDDQHRETWLLVARPGRPVGRIGLAVRVHAVATTHRRRATSASRERGSRVGRAAARLEERDGVGSDIRKLDTVSSTTCRVLRPGREAGLCRHSVR